MRRLALCAVLAPLVGACSATTESSILGAVVPQVALANNALAQLDPTIAKACARIIQAEMYFNDLKPLIMDFKSGPVIVAKEAAYVKIVNADCAHPPSNVVQAYNELNSAWTQIQVLTTTQAK
jgi:hypothetical protein